MSKKLDDLVAGVAADRPNVDFAAGRREFMRSAGLGAAGIAALGLAVPATMTSAQAAASVDLQVLTFALNLEYLEGEFYARAYTGNGLAASDRGGNPGTVIPPKTHKVAFQSSAVAAYAKELTQDETNHVRFLRSAIAAAGVVPASAPTIDLNNSFTTAARAAGLIGPSATFDPFASDANFLLASYIFEDVGVTAYQGGAGLLTNKTYLNKAAGILAVEAYHAGIIRTVLFSMGYSSQTNAISVLRTTLDQTRGTPRQGNDHGVGTVSSPSIVDADSQSITGARSVTEVLNIVYGNTSTKPGLFFPNGINMPT